MNIYSYIKSLELLKQVPLKSYTLDRITVNEYIVKIWIDNSMLIIKTYPELKRLIRQLQIE